MGKRGLSAVVTTLLVILLAIVAIGIVWVVIRNVVSQGSEDIALEKFTLDIAIKYAYVDGDNIKVGIRRSAGEGTLSGLKFVFKNSSTSVSVEKDSSLGQLEEGVYTFSSSEVPGINSGDDVSVAPIYVSSSGSKQTLDITDTEEISSQAPPIIIGGEGDQGDGTNDSGDGSGDETVCGNGICETGEDALSCPDDCSSSSDSCNSTWDGDAEDSGVECDGGTNCEADCTCPTGFTADGAGGCDLNPAINTGTIFSVWPSGAVKYFDSEDLPVDVSGYIGNYVNFTSAGENGCFQITYAEYLEVNGRSYLRTEFIINVTAGETYYVWEAQNCGL